MGLSTSLANALTGLTAASRRAEVVSSNVSNALTPGYARREVNLSSQSLGGNGGGVKIDGVTRSLNQSILSDRRLAEADVGNAGSRTSFLTMIEKSIGQPGTPGALTDQIAALDAAFVQAASRPDSQARLQNVLSTASDLASKLNTLTKTVQLARMDADSSIAKQVDDINTALMQIDGLNGAILTQRSSGHDASALLDQRQILIDRVSKIVPVREVARDHDQISLYTSGGAILLEGNPVKVGFTPVGTITADMTLASGALSGLTIGGMQIGVGDGGLLGGGTLGARFAIRDDLAPQVQTQIDAFARDLIGRFESPSVDPTLVAGQPGLFSDAGAVFDPLAEVGLAGRIEINALVDPSRGGALWRLRDGLGAMAAGDVGNATLLVSLRDVLLVGRIPLSGSFIGAGRSSGGLAADVLSQVAGSRQSADLRQSYSTARYTALTELQLQDGVDTDAELQTLLQVEQAFAANARVVQTIDDLIQQLIGL